MSTRYLHRLLGSLWTAALAAGALALASPAAQAVAGETIQGTVQRGLNFLTPDVVDFSRTDTCQACHRQGAALYGISVAKSSGYTINTSTSDGVGFLAQHAKNDQTSYGYWTHFGSHTYTKTSYSFMGLAGFDQHVNTLFSQDLVRAANWAVSSQYAGGYWPEDHGSFPTTFGTVPVTARMMVGIAQAKARVDSATAASYQAALTRAANWIRANRDTGETLRTFQIGYAILGLKAAGAADNDADVVFLRNRLLNTTSRPTGRAWGYVSTDPADGFNTGIALYALKQVGAQLRDYPVMKNAVMWLRDIQSGAGSWQSSGQQIDITTTFAILGLSPWGDLGVKISAPEKSRQVIDAHAPTAQTVTYALTIANEGAFDFTDTYTLSIQGGLPGWTAQVSPLTLTLGSGQSGSATLTVTAPPNLPEALPADVTVIATSKANPAISSSVVLTTYTNPPPPVTGLTTSTVFVAGNGATVSARTTPTRLAASAKNGSATIVGPGKGVMTFYVAGIPVGSDSDADGNGVFEVLWTPGFAWNQVGTQDFRAIYSGIDLPAPQPDLMPSLVAGTIHVLTPPDTDKDGLPDELERQIGTDPTKADTDGDGLSDGVEVNDTGTDPLNRDTDGDGLSDGDEVARGLDPLNPDSDGDGYSDGEEVAGGSDPKNGASLPLPPPRLAFTGHLEGTRLPAEGGASGGGFSFDLSASCGTDVPCTVQIFDGSSLLDSFDAKGFWLKRYTLPLGAHQLRVTATNKSGTDSKTFTLTGVPNAPQLLQPADGFRTSYSAVTIAGVGVPGGTVSIQDDGLQVAAVPVDGSGSFATTLELGYRPHALTFTQSVNGTGSAQTAVSLDVRCLPPTVSGNPGDLVVEALSPAGSPVFFAPPSALNCHGESIPVSCSRAPESLFAQGGTPVSCEATDFRGQTSGFSFAVFVRDTTPPELSVPEQTVVAEATDASGAQVLFDTSARDVASVGVRVQCTPASGAIFALGTTTVTCDATDAAGLVTTKSFAVEVQDTTAPAFLVATLPLDQLVEATGAGGAFAGYSAPLADDLVDGALTASCSPLPGTFALGHTVVHCVVYDRAGNHSDHEFSVRVQDTTPAVLTVPSDITVVASHVRGNVVTYAASALDLVDGALTPTCTPASGSLFAAGTTNVTCSVTDAAGSTSSRSFVVRVQYASSIETAPVTNGDATYKQGSTIPVKFQLSGASAGVPDGRFRLFVAKSANGIIGPELPATANGAFTENLFRYGDGSYQYNLATKPLSAGTWVLRIDLGDGVSHTQTITLR